MKQSISNYSKPGAVCAPSQGFSVLSCRPASFNTLLSLLILFVLLFPPYHGKAQSLAFDGAGTTLLDDGVMVATHGSTTLLPSSSRYVLRLFNVRGTLYSSPGYTSSVNEYTHSDWTATKMGNVDGLTIDADKNIYVAASSSANSFEANAAWRYGSIGGGSNNLGAAGTIYKVDAASGDVEVFAQLHQQDMALAGASPRSTGPGLGGIDFDRLHNQFFAANLENGKIYRISASGVILQVFDPLVFDNSAAGMAPSGELVRALAVFGNRLYYAVSNYSFFGAAIVQVRSVEINSGGLILPATDQAEISDDLSAAFTTTGYYTDVVDIEFSSSGKMALGTRTFYNNMPYAQFSGESPNVVYEKVGGLWTRAIAYSPGVDALVFPANSFGGLAWGSYAGGVDKEELLWTSFGDVYGDRNGAIGAKFSDLPNDLDSNAAGLDFIAFEFFPTIDLVGLAGNIEIAKSDSLTVSTSIVNSCILPSGAIDITVSGGIPPYTYLWSNGATTQDISGLAEGDYTVTIADGTQTVDVEFEILDYCSADPDCSSDFSSYFDAAGTKLMAKGVMAITCGATTLFPDSSRYTLALVDVRNESYDTAAVTPVAYHHDDWIVDKIGNVDGLELDGFGNIYVTASSYFTSFFPYDWRYGSIGGGANDLGAAGTVYRIDATTGQPTVFAQLPQLLTDLYDYASFASSGFLMMPLSRLSGPGLGNITHNEVTGNFYVSNLEDGKIYRLGADGSVLGSFDPLTPDNNLAGFPPETEIVYGLDIFAGRLYYLMRGGGAQDVIVRSVVLSATGDFLPASDQLEINDTWTGASVGLFELVGYDIAFSDDGKMAIGTRTFANSLLEIYSHSSYNAVYTQAAGGWTMSKSYGPGSITGGSVLGPGESYGGVAWGPYQMGPDYDELLWASSGDMFNDEHGVIGIEYASLPNSFALGNDGLNFVAFEYMPGAGDLKGIGGDVAIWKGGPAFCDATAVDDTYFTEMDTPLNENVTTNDTDLGGLPLGVFTDGCGPYHGNLLLHESGTFTYEPDPGFIGLDSFCYVACNPMLVCDEAMVYINVTGSNPIAVDDLAGTQEDLQTIVLVASNDSGVDLDVTSVDIINPPAAAEATLLNNLDGTVLFSPAPNYFGIVSFDYQISGLSGGRDTATAIVYVLPVADPPTAVDDAYYSVDSLSIVLDPFSNDYDVDGDLDLGSLTLLNGIPVAQGVLSVVGTTFLFTPSIGYCGPVNPISYQIADLAGALDTGTIFISLGCYNILPEARIDSSEVCFGGAITTDVLANDTDLDGVLDLTTLSVIVPPVFGFTAVNTDGTIKYIHSGYGGSIDTYVYRIQDDAGGISEATVEVTINEPLLLNASIADPTCGNSNGVIDINVLAGFGPFSFSWSTTDTTEDLAGVPAGTYTLFILDGNDCSKGINIELEDGPPLEIENVTVVDASGCNATDGGLVIDLADPSAVSPPYFVIVNGIYTAGPFMSDPIVATGAPAGAVVTSLTVMDAVGCTDMVSGPISIGAPPPPVIESIDFDGADCGDSEATILVNLDDVEIGTPPYLMVLLPGPVSVGPIAGGSDTLAFSVPFGNYARFKLFDSNACQDRFNSSFTLAPLCDDCPHPENRDAIVNGGFTAFVHWSPVAEALAYEVRIRPYGSTGWIGVPITIDTIRLIGQMTPLTTYEWQVRSICDTSYLSPWSPSDTFTTLPALEPKLGFEEGSGLVLYPNPAFNQTVLSINFGQSVSGKLLIVNALGEVVFENTAEMHKGLNELELPLSNLAAGHYEVVFEGQSGASFQHKRAKLIVLE